MSAPLATWARKQELDQQAERNVARAVRESGTDAPAHPNTGSIHDPKRMRGIPCLTHHGLGGHIPGTRP